MTSLVSSSPLQIALRRLIGLSRQERRALAPIRVEGEQAWIDNRATADNPYPSDSNEWAAWLTGWDAEKERQS